MTVTMDPTPAITAAPPVKVGDVVWLPRRLQEAERRAFLPNTLHAQAVELEEQITGKPGRVVTIVDGWAMVHRPGWGEFGAPVGDLVLAATAEEVAAC